MTDEHKVVFTGFPSRESAEEMARFLYARADHYLWLKVEVVTESNEEGN